MKAPKMLTTPNKLSETTSKKINNWSIKNVLIGGGYKSVAKSVEDSLGVDNKERVAGIDIFETAIKISQRLSQVKNYIGK
ncbi:hypothetical protein [Metaclostridioides mangenotii]|uniref:hypothetical protein n=1 Tax=Metaclostridioides mangenotii TaxID=1540 RepID=UPI00048200D9|nr:hypothetical protein [Clostridioides mangenotii]